MAALETLIAGGLPTIVVRRSYHSSNADSTERECLQAIYPTMIIVVVALKSSQWEDGLGPGQSIQVPVVVRNIHSEQPVKSPLGSSAPNIETLQDSQC